MLACALTGCEKPPDSPEASAEWKKDYAKVVKEGMQSARKSREMLWSHLRSLTPDADIYDSLVEEAYKRDLNPLAYAGLRRLLKRRPGDMELHRLIARILREEGFLTESEQHVSHQLSLKPNDAELFSELLRTHFAAYSVEKAHELLLSTELPRKCSSYYKIAARIQEVRGNSQAAFDSMFLSLEDDTYFLGSSRFRDLARISRQLGRPLLARHFYALYRSNTSPKDLHEMYKDILADEDYSVERATLVVSLQKNATIKHHYHISIAVRRAVSEFYIPILLPSEGSPGRSEVEVAPNRGFRLLQTSDGKTRIHHLAFEQPLAQATEAAVDIKFTMPADFTPKHPWIWYTVPVVYPCRLHLAAGSGFGVDGPSMVRENREDDLSIDITRTSSGFAVRPTLQKMFFMPAVSFSQEPAVLYWANKMVGIALFFTLVAFFAALLMHYRASRGVGWALLIFSAVYTVPIFFDFIPASLFPDLPDVVLGRVFSPEQQFPQRVVAALLGCIVFVLACFCTWLMATHQVDFTVSGERVAFVYVPVMFPLVLAAFGCFTAAQVITDNIGWKLPTYVFAAGGVVLCACSCVLLWQWGQSMCLFGVAVGLVLVWWVNRHLEWRLLSQVVFGFCTVAFTVNMWTHYRRTRGKLPDTITESMGLLDKLQLSLSNTLDRYWVFLKVGGIISGVVAFLSGLIVFFGSTR